MSHIKDIFPSLGMDMGSVDGRNPSSTKKGPGRKHSQGHKKSSGNKSTFKRAAVNKKVKVQQQTDNVTNTPLKAATRGG